MLALALTVLQSQAEIARAQAMIPAVIAGCLLFGVVAVLLVIIPLWFICKKAGLSPWLSLIVLFPAFGGLILLYILAFTEWKVVPAPLAGYTPPVPPPYPPQA